MTRVTYEKGNGEYRLTTEGHAGFGPHGADIVCAAVSMLGQALLAWLGDGAQEVCLDKGRFSVTAQGGESVEAAFDMAATGLALLGESYPQNVEFHTAPLGGDTRERPWPIPARKR